MTMTPDAPAVSEPSTGPAEPVTFAGLGISPDLVSALAAKGIVEPFPIQALTIADALAGRDVCG
ncbi:MAG: DEAD/DEAH box helicase, partial [Acidimicrobiales bacterium]